MGVLEIILKNNNGIKTCFVREARASGKLPSFVQLRFDLLKSGKATGATIVESQYRGTSFESCMSGAVSQISFPPSERDQRITYPFKLQ